MRAPPAVPDAKEYYRAVRSFGVDSPGALPSAA